MKVPARTQGRGGDRGRKKGQRGGRGGGEMEEVNALPLWMSTINAYLSHLCWKLCQQIVDIPNFLCISTNCMNYHIILQKILPKYEKLENKVETMNEYKKVDEETRKAVGESVPTECDIPYVDLKKTLDQVGGDFNKKHERWGKIILSNAP